MYRHHPNICDKSEAEMSQMPQVENVLQNKTQPKSVEIPEPTKSSTATMYVDATNSVLLQTDQAEVSGTDDETSKKVRVILDNCSHRSCVK